MNINSDLGEAVGQDEEILPRIDSANVCCAAHAGSINESVATVRRCHELGVEVAAHPGFEDRGNFGRVEHRLPLPELEGLIRFQIGALAALSKLGYVKAHGALYHVCQADAESAEVLVRISAEFGLGVMGQPGYGILAACEKLGVKGYREGFADRAYLPNGLLAPRSQPGSVLQPDAAAEQALREIRSGKYDSICLHGDSPGAAATAKRIREAITEAGVETGPLGT